MSRICCSVYCLWLGLELEPPGLDYPGRVVQNHELLPPGQVEEIQRSKQSRFVQRLYMCRRLG